MLLRADAEGRKRIGRAWREEEQRFIDWVAAHPNPKPEWIETVDRLKQRRVDEEGWLLRAGRYEILYPE